MDTNYKFESVFSYRPCLIGDVRPRMEEVESVDHVCIVKKRSLIKLPNLAIWSSHFVISTAHFLYKLVGGSLVQLPVLNDYLPTDSNDICLNFDDKSVR